MLSMEMSHRAINKVIEQNSLVEQVGNVQPNDVILWRHFEDNPDLSPATTMKLKSILSSSKKSSLLQVELASLIDAGEAFVKATYKLEGDGAVVFECYDILAELHAGISTAYIPTLNSLCATLSCGVLNKATELRK